MQLRARVEGFLEKVLFTEGQDVKTGDLLYEIEKTQYQAAMEQAKANLAAAQAQELNAELTFNRSSELSKNQTVPQAVLDQSRANLDSAKASVLQNEAALTIARENLGYTDVKSPIDGRIGLTAYTQGNLVNPASGVLATIVSQDPIYVQFPVSVREFENVRAARKQENGRLIKIEVLVASVQRPRIPPSGRMELHGHAGRSADRHADHAGDLAEPGAAACGRRFRDGRGQGAPGTAASRGSASGAPGGSGGQLRARRERRRSQGRAQAREDGTRGRYGRRRRRRPAARRKSDRRWGAEGTGRGRRSMPRSSRPAVEAEG